MKFNKALALLLVLSFSGVGCAKQSHTTSSALNKADNTSISPIIPPQEEVRLLDQDQRYGKVQDNTQAILDAGLAPDFGHSQLSGAVALENVLVKFRGELNLSDENPVEDLKKIVEFEPGMVNHGIEHDSFAGIIQKQIHDSLRHPSTATVHVVGSNDFHLTDLQDAIKDQHAVIIQISWWKKDQFNAKDPWSVDPENSRYVTVIGFDENNPNHVLIQDPASNDPIFMDLSSGYPTRALGKGHTFQNQMVRYESDLSPVENADDYVILMADYISITVSMNLIEPRNKAFLNTAY